jgi:flavin reductase (DIM6/NTAB) family NADH-FMN oxidoreductase RutF
MSLLNKVFFNGVKIQTFAITRLSPGEVEEKVFLKKGKHYFEITKHHGMICLDPFCMAVWLPQAQADLIEGENVDIQFTKDIKLNASIKVSPIEKIDTEHGALLLYQIEKVKNYQLSALHRLLLFAHFLRSKKNTYNHRKTISALYSYPRNIIIVSYKDEDYYNIFPMDIHGYIEEEGLYILGLRTTNVTLEKILEAKKVVVCDTNTADVKTVYDLGKHSSKEPTKIEEMPFGINESEQFGFYIPDFVGSYKEIEIIRNKKMGYHMLMIGKVINTKKMKPESSSLYHVGFLQYQMGDYENIDGLF